MPPKSPSELQTATESRFWFRSCAAPTYKIAIVANLALLCSALVLYSYLFHTCFVNGRFSPAWQPNSPLLTCTHAVPQHLAHFARAPVVEHSTFDMNQIFHPHTDGAVGLHRDTKHQQEIRIMLELSQRILREVARERSIVVRDVTVGYSYLDRHDGARYLAHVTSTAERSGDVRHDMLLFHNSFSGQCQVSVRHYAARVMKQTVYMIVPYSSRPERLKWFLDQFELLRDDGQNVQLLLSLCGTSESDASYAMRQVHQMKEAHHVHVVRHKMDAFNRAVCLREAAATITNNSLLFFTDVDMQISNAWFDRCRMNALPGIQAYFPKVYNTFPGKEMIGIGHGSWIEGGYGISCMYKFDFDAVAAYKNAETEFDGWGGEDFRLEQAFEVHPQLEVFRAVEPTLIHKWHPKVCEPSITFYNNCIGTKLHRMGVAQYVAHVLEQEGIDIQQVVLRNLTS